MGILSRFYVYPLTITEQVKFSDFLLLLYLPRIMDWKLVREIIHAVKTGVSPEPSVVTQIEYALKAYT